MIACNQQDPYATRAFSKSSTHDGLINQSVYEVLEFSSQYGGDTCMSYSARNIIGGPTVFPRAGDHAHSFHLRTYGPWWEILPSAIKRKPILPDNSVDSHDFIEFRYKRWVSPVSMEIYETYNPGAVFKIWGYCYEKKRWIALWSEEPHVLDCYDARILSIELKEVDFMTNLYRIEFYHKHLKYHCELDAVCLAGRDRIIADFKPKLTIVPQDPPLVSQSTSSSTCFFESLPHEVFIHILSYLDLRSLSVAAQVSKLFQRLCYDSALYRDVNLKPYWCLVDSQTLTDLAPRLNNMKHFTLSWCGGQRRLQDFFFCQFIERHCSTLTSLRLTNCQFVNNLAVKAISESCPLLEELELRSCRHNDLSHSGFKCIAQLSNLNYLDLYRTLVDKYSLVAIIQNCHKLEHIFLGACYHIGNFNEVARRVSKHLKGIKTLDFWRGIPLGCAGIHELAQNCHELVEIDLGWCSTIDATCGCIRALISNCTKLKKLFLSALRTISNADLNAVAECCKGIEQLDVLGSREVTIEAVENVLNSCKDLKLLDVSFCDESVYDSIETLRDKFRGVDIKCSFATDD